MHSAPRPLFEISFARHDSVFGVPSFTAKPLCIRTSTYLLALFFFFSTPSFLTFAEHAAGERKASCRKSETAQLFGEPVEHRFTVFNTAVYPRYMYAKMREFVGQLHGSTFSKVVTWTDKSWTVPSIEGGCSLAERDLVLPDAEFMGAFLWWVKEVVGGLFSFTIRTFEADLWGSHAQSTAYARASK